eukprot:15251978-Ditylum_brightwellii.AAC.2
MPVSNTWHMHDPKTATEISDHITLHYNMMFKANHEVSANRPDIVIWDSAKKCAFFIDATVLMDISMIKAAAEKYKRFRDLEIAYKKEFQLQKVHTIPIVVGALGTLYKNFDTCLAKVSPIVCADPTQKEVLLGTTYILRRVLAGTPKI